MNSKLLIIAISFLHITFFSCKHENVERGDEIKHSYKPEWDSLDKHPCPEWYDQAKFGLFLHWGPYSAEDGGRHEFMNPDLLTANKYDPNEWIDLAEIAGVRYITLTTKHGGGFCMFDTSRGKWNSVQSGPKRDLFGEFATACHQHGMRFLAYYCKDDIFMPFKPGVAIKDQKVFQSVVDTYDMQGVIDNWTQWFRDNLKTIVNKYNPDGFWFDGTNPDYQYTKIAEVIAWMYNKNPDLIIDDRVGSYTQRKVHGDFFTYEREWIKPVHILSHKWERSCPMLGGGWVYDKDLTLGHIAEPKEIIWDLIDIVSLGGNYNMGIGPKADGSIPEYYKIRLKQIGEWMDVNGEAIYGTKPWIWGYYKEGEQVRFTMSRDEKTIYVFCKGYPRSELTLEYLNSNIAVVKSANLLGFDLPLKFHGSKLGGCVFEMPEQKPDLPHDIYVLKLRVDRDVSAKKP